MAGILSRICGAGCLKSKNGVIFNQVCNLSTAQDWTKHKKAIYITLGVIAGSTGAVLFGLDQSVKASDLELHPPKHPWSHNGWFSSLDHASIRRGYEVYKQLCSACHSLRYLAYRNLKGVSHTERQAKAEASEIEVRDGPDETGEMFMRPGKLSDYFPSPYPNEEAARAANNGSYPPDLSFITSARHGGEDYIFALLTGYCDAPAGIVLRDGQYFNPYFPGGAISMAQVLYNEAMEYSDGTPASASQLAKDVSTFLRWACEPEHDERKKMAIKAFGLFSIMVVFAFYIQRHRFASMKTRKIVFVPRTEK